VQTFLKKGDLQRKEVTPFPLFKRSLKKKKAPHNTPYIE